MRFFAYALLGILLPATVFAQGVFGTGGPALTLAISPDYPRPYDTITASLSSNSIDLAAAIITILADGKEIPMTNGRARVTLGAAGSATVVKAIATIGGQAYSASQTVRPAEVALIAEPAATSHPFYPGGFGIPSQGQVRLVALPDLRATGGKRFTDGTLVYKWKLNGQELADLSGIGRSVVSMTAPVRYRDATIEVTVLSPDQSLVADSVLRISPSDPSVRVYESDPLLGIRYDRALGDEFAMPGAEATFVAVPYGFARTPAIVWTVNSGASGSNPAITLRSTGGKGSAAVSVTATLPQLFETATRALRISFGETSGGTGIFGL
ncbi:MAG: hypothetical protein WDN10_03310 [bacterium]